MHELSIVQSLLDIIREEMAKHEVTTLLTVTVKHGKLANVVPDAMQFAWEVLTKETDFESAKLVTEEIPLVLRCGGCRREFTPEDLSAIVAPCPYCGEQLGHEFLSGRELYIERIEAQ